LGSLPLKRGYFYSLLKTDLLSNSNPCDIEVQTPATNFAKTAADTLNSTAEHDDHASVPYMISPDESEKLAPQF
jgi:hypothetical protein